MSHQVNMLDLDPESAEGRIEFIRRGITPRRVEQSYEENCTKDLLAETGMRQGQLTKLARAWPIDTEWYRRGKHLAKGPGSRGRAI